MRSRIVTIIIGVIVIIGFAIYLIFGRSGGTAGSGTGAGVGSSGTVDGTPVTVSQAYPDAPTTDRISIGTAAGIVQVANFYEASGTTVGDDGVLVISRGAGYWITYDPSDSSFWVAVSGTPFESVRQAAEADFLAALGVSRGDACKLAVSVGAPYAAGSALNGQSFPLSFCPH
ncbi:MAG TPA: hypothetical protein VMT99_02965 [Candidatus Paceibacterota bacterium]|nr:hypothetical protein [Candidatus Paceibacterota bacterium]